MSPSQAYPKVLAIRPNLFKRSPLANHDLCWLLAYLYCIAKNSLRLLCQLTDLSLLPSLSKDDKPPRHLKEMTIYTMKLHCGTSNFNELCTSCQIRTDTFVETNRLAINALPYFDSWPFRCFCKFYSLAGTPLTTSSNHSVATINIFYHSSSF